MLILGPLISIGALALAFALGDRPERAMAALIGTVLLVSILLQLAAGTTTQLPAAMADILLLGGSVLLAMYYRRLWLWAEVAVAVALVTAQVVCPNPLDPPSAFRMLVNALDLFDLGLLVAMTVSTARAGERRSVPRLVG